MTDIHHTEAFVAGAGSALLGVVALSALGLSPTDAVIGVGGLFGGAKLVYDYAIPRMTAFGGETDR